MLRFDVLWDELQLNFAIKWKFIPLVYGPRCVLIEFNIYILVCAQLIAKCIHLHPKYSRKLLVCDDVDS